jgi:hypothetical protein
MANTRDFTGKNRKFTGTKGITLSKGTTGQRVGSESGELRFNTTTELMEYYDGNQWKSVDAPPTISNITTNDATGSSTVLNSDGSTLYTITINGGNFSLGPVVKFIGSTGTEYAAGNINRVSNSQITCTTLSNMSTADDPYDVQVTNGSGLSANLDDAFSYNAPPVFTVASGQLGTVYDTQTISGTTLNAGATDAEGNTITFSIISGSLPGSGLSISSSTGAITGTLSGSPSLGNYPFVVRASTSEGVVERQFSIQVVVNPYVQATGGTTVTTGGYKYHTFTSSGSFVVSSGGSAPFNVSDYLIVAGGGAGGHRHAGGGGAGGLRQSTATLSAQTYTITVGGGGAKFTNQDQSGRVGRDGNNSSALSITSTGGGGGGDNGPAGRSGGSGGGGGESGSGAGSGTPGQGNPGGSGNGGYGGGAGGGGFGATGTAGASGGQGGIGGSSPTITAFASATSTGSGSRYAAGGGGGGYACGGRAAAGGTGGGGTGGGDDRSGTDAVQNTGSGGGGGGQTVGPIAGSGADGIVIIRYPVP